MDELTRVLWEYAGQRCLEGCYDLEMRQERGENEQAAGRSREGLEKLCPSQTSEQIENLCYSLEVIRTVDMEAAFTCGLRLGLSLRM